VLVVQGGWVPGADRPGRLALWAERPDPGEATPSRARRRPHPFAEPAGPLAEILGEPVDAAVAGTLTLQLPGTPRGPVPSPETGLEAPTRGIRLGAWTVPALLVPAEAALAALAGLAEPGAGGAGAGESDAGESDAGGADAGEPGAGEPGAGEPGAGESWQPAASLRYLSVLALYA